MPTIPEINIKDIPAQSLHGTVTGVVSDVLAAWQTKPWTLNQLPGVITLTSTPSSLTPAHEGCLLVLNFAAAGVLNIPLDASVTWPVGGRVLVQRAGAGQITVTALSGVTLQAAGRPKFRVQGSCAELIKIAPNSWLMFGDTLA